MNYKKEVKMPQCYGTGPAGHDAISGKDFAPLPLQQSNYPKTQKPQNLIIILRYKSKTPAIEGCFISVFYLYLGH